MQRSRHGKENSSPAHKAVPPTLAPPPRMRALLTTDGSNLSTPCSMSPEDFSRSGSIVRHVRPEDPYSDHVGNGSVQHTFSHPDPRMRALPRPPSALQYREMPPPPRPLYRSPMDDTASSTTSSVPPSLASSIGTSSRQISATSTANSHIVDGAVAGSENWESYDDGDTSEPDPDASDLYWQKLTMQQQMRGTIGAGMSMRMGRAPGIATESRLGSDDGVE